MTRNLSSADRIVRIAAGAILGALALATGITSALGVLLAVVAVVLLGTAALASCPLYSVLGISTCPAPHRTRRGDVGASQRG